MGYKIWRKDHNGWSLAFDTVYPTREKVDEAIAEANARYHEMVKYGELTFYPYRDDIKLSKDGNVIDPNIPVRMKMSKFKNKRRQHHNRFN
jgi:hypothetical protein